MVIIFIFLLRASSKTTDDDSSDARRVSPVKRGVSELARRLLFSLPSSLLARSLVRLVRIE